MDIPNRAAINPRSGHEKPISLETAELLRIEFQFVHTLSLDKKYELARKYQLTDGQVEQFFKIDMKEQRNEEIRKMNLRSKPKEASGEMDFDKFEKIQAAKKTMGFSNSDVLALPPKTAQKKKLMQNVMSSAAGTSLGTTTSAQPKKKVPKAKALQILRQEFKENSKLPASRKLELAQKLGMDPEAVREFFVNKRKNTRGWVWKSTVRLPKFMF